MEQKHNYTLKQTKWKKFGVDFYQWHPVIPPVLQPSKLSLARQIIRRFQDLIPHRRYAPPSKKGGLNLYKSQGSPKQALANTFEKNPVTWERKPCRAMIGLNRSSPMVPWSQPIHEPLEVSTFTEGFVRCTDVNALVFGRFFVTGIIVLSFNCLIGLSSRF